VVVRSRSKRRALLREEACKDDGDEFAFQGLPRMEVKTIAVIGAGAMGREFAYASIFSGFKTVLEDVSTHVLEKAMIWIRQSVEETPTRGKVGAAAWDKALALLSTSSDVKDAIRDAELIIETVPEELEMKLELFTIFDKFAKTGAIFASNATSLSISEFTDVTVSRDRCIGMRFLDLAPKMSVIELVRTPYTSDETIALCRGVAQRMARQVVVVSDGQNGTGR
jgi:3-hydroxybutyryl-CoA dehydrogenase